MSGDVSLHSDQPEQGGRSEIEPVDNEPSEADVKVDAALGDLVRCAYHDRWLRGRLQTVEDGIRALRAENEALRIDLAAAYCRMDDMEGQL